MTLNQSICRKLVLCRRLFSTNSGYLISYPKSGRTWLRLMLENLNCFVKASHSASNISQGLHFCDLPSPDIDPRLPSLFLFRNPLDVVVSSWFQYRFRIDSSIAIPLKDFIRHPSYGLEKIIRFNLMYLEYMPPDSVKYSCINYESLIKYPVLCLEQIFRFYLPHVPVSSDSVAKSVSRYSFNNMKAIERDRSRRYGVSFFGAVAGDPDQPDSFKVRRGVVGGYKDYLDDSDIHYCQQLISSHDYSHRLQAIQSYLLPVNPLSSSIL